MASKKLTQAQIKKSLSQMEKPELIDIICKLCKSSEEAKDQINLMLGNDSFVDDALEETKRKVCNQFFSVLFLPLFVFIAFLPLSAADGISFPQ